VVQGTLTLALNGSTARINTGDWFEIPALAEHDIHYETDCSIIEFWFDRKK
jgi:quercetin dioxygenase-like cupin family protein